MTSTDKKGRANRIRFEQPGSSGDDAKSHSFKRIELEIDHAKASLLRAAADRGEPVYVRFSDDNGVQGHVYRVTF